MVYYLALRESPRVYKEILLISKEKSERVVVLGDIQRAFSSSVVLRSSSIAAALLSASVPDLNDTFEC